MACASTLSISADRALLEEEIKRLTPASFKLVPMRVTIKVDAPELAAGQKLGRTGEPSFDLKYPAREMLEQVAQASAVRWFGNNSQSDNSASLEVRLHRLTWDKYRDVLVWRPVVHVEIELRAEIDSQALVQQVFSSGMQKGEWVKDFAGQTMITKEHNPQYTHLIYRAMLLALDKAMADLAQRIKGSTVESMNQAKPRKKGSGLAMKHPQW
jgi:hypothetical protein